MTPRVYILCGASGSGKTTLLNSVAALGPNDVDPHLKAVRAPKFSERQLRQKPGEVDDITHVEKIRLGEIDVAYVINNVRYGIKIDPIRDLLRQGLNPFIVLSDLRVVRRIKEIFGTQAKALYVSSAIDADKLRRIQRERVGFSPTDEQKSVLAYHFARTLAAARLGWWDRVSGCMDDLETYWHAYATDAHSTEIRAQKIRAFHIRYIEHISLFDHVILNYSEDKPGEMAIQGKSLLNRLDAYESFKQKSYPPIFVVAAASGAGKGELMETLQFIGGKHVLVTSKLAKRYYREHDKRDGMVALFRKPTDPPPEWPSGCGWSQEMEQIAKEGAFPQAYDLQWEFHKSSGKGTPYAVSSAEIQRNIDAGIPQIFVSNMDQFSRFRQLWPGNTVFIYLHRLVSDQDYRDFQMKKWKDDPVQAEIRIAERAQVHAQYLQEIPQFDHVLLNTGYKEDLYDQMFRLLEHYAKTKHCPKA